ncbi:MAG: dihydrofolate reductase, partial [Bacteroidales bacterium]|nr:dihydrofolate reductase [Bacteroidales bacterium]
MKRLIRIMISFGALAIIAGCQQRTEEEIKEFHYLLDEFADLKVMRYKVPGWEDLTLQQKEYAYYLAEAAKFGRDILWDQNGEYNLRIRHAVENILENYKGDRGSEDFRKFETYAKRLFFSNGIYHHYAEDRFTPECSQAYFQTLMESVGDGGRCQLLLPVIYGSAGKDQRRSTSTDGDIVQLSGVNFYDGVTRQEVEDYYASIAVPDDPHPISYGLNTKVVKENGKVVEKPWKVGGIYDGALSKICEQLEKAAAVAENDIQKHALELLIEYYKTGDLRKWDEFNVEWVKDTEGTVDFINGFVEDYNDPLGRKGAWEGYVNIKDKAASERTEILCGNAQWFEDNAPIDPRFKKKEVKGITAKVVNAVCLAGDSYPSTPIGINLPNADWIRKDHGSKSVTIANITHAYDYAAEESPASALKEFAYDDAEIEFYKKYGSYADEIHTDLHECLGHGSG